MFSAFQLVDRFHELGFVGAVVGDLLEQFEGLDFDCFVDRGGGAFLGAACGVF